MTEFELFYNMFITFYYPFKKFKGSDDYIYLN